MTNQRLVWPMMVLSLAVAAGACNRQKSTAPDVQRTTGEVPRSEPVTVSGCLQSGAIAENTFVLNATQPEAVGTTATSTYQLQGGDVDMLRQHVGERVEVSGTVEAEQKVTSSSGTVQEDRAKATNGTPTVETKATIDVKRLDVDSVKPSGQRCS
jgi:hypothetical protein